MLEFESYHYRGGSRISKGGVDGRPYLLTRHLGNYPQDPGNEVAIKPEHRLSTWVGKRERFPTNFAIMSQSESYFASLGVVKWLPCELLREKWRQTTKRGVTTTRHERELIFLSFFIFYFKQSDISNSFFTEKWGVDIHPIHPPCIRPCIIN